jgi:hypothetical protein
VHALEALGYRETELHLIAERLNSGISRRESGIKEAEITIPDS